MQTLELVEDSLGTSEGSLLRFLSQAVSPAGRRKVRAWLVSPLFRCAAGRAQRNCMIMERLGAWKLHGFLGDSACPSKQ